MYFKQDFEQEYQRQAFFKAHSQNNEIPATKFADIMKTLRGHLLTPYVRAYLLTVSTLTVTSKCYG